MTSKTVKLVGDTQRAYAKRLVDQAPAGYLVQFKEPTRNLEQNAKMHAMVADIVKADPIGHGYDIDDYKTVLVGAFKGELRMLQGIDGGFLPAGRQTSKLSVGAMKDFIEFIYAYGAREGVTWSEPKQERAA